MTELPSVFNRVRRDVLDSGGDLLGKDGLVGISDWCKYQ